MSIVTQNFKPTPYWWEAAPPTKGTREIPNKSYDVIVIGSGVSGLSTALTLAEGGRSVAVFEAGLIGSGASSRSNGAVVTNFGEELSEAKFGAEKLSSISRLAVDSANYLLMMPEKYKFDPLLKHYDRYILALTEKHAQRFSRSAEKQLRRNPDLQWKPQPLTRNEVVEQTGLTGFFGGLLIPQTLSMQPSLYTQGMASACADAGVELFAHCKVSKLTRIQAGFEVQTPHGVVSAKNVVAATNGYTGDELPMFRKRIMNVRLYMAATEPVPRSLYDRIFPSRRKFSSSKANMAWIRPSPDGTCILIGGRGGMGGDDAVKHAKALHTEMSELMPELSFLKFTHCWYGETGFPHDFVPHVGTLDGIHYLMGYCGRGMALGTYLGNRLAHKILGSDPDLSRTPLDDLKFPVEPVPGFLRNAYLKTGLKWTNFKDWRDLRLG